LNIVVAPNAFKGSLSAVQAADAMCSGIRRVLADAGVRCLPVADGGDGLLDVLQTPLAAERRVHRVPGPLDDAVDAAFLYNPSRHLAVVEMATAAGLALLDPDRLDVLHASSRGVGELLRAALDLGATQIVLGIGGSATNDAGTGLATALGLRFLDARGRPLAGNGANLRHIRHIDRSAVDPRLATCTLEVLCDVTNPLLGPLGPARVYAPQKGATPDVVTTLEQGLSNLATVIERDLGRRVGELSGGGAAGGTGAGLNAFFGARLQPGAPRVLELLGAEAAIAAADLVLTGEGRLDGQTRHGKAPGAVAALARKHAVPCIAIAGHIEDSIYRSPDNGFDAVFSLCPGPLSIEHALAHAADYLGRTTEHIIRCLCLPKARH
jgi:glycerate kinase